MRSYLGCFFTLKQVKEAYQILRIQKIGLLWAWLGPMRSYLGCFFTLKQ